MYLVTHLNKKLFLLICNLYSICTLYDVPQKVNPVFFVAGSNVLVTEAWSLRLVQICQFTVFNAHCHKAKYCSS